MKVEYIKCDICGERINPCNGRYKYTTLVRYPEERINALGDSVSHEEKLDVCKPCFDQMKEWIKFAQAKKGAKDGTTP